MPLYDDDDGSTCVFGAPSPRNLLKEICGIFSIKSLICDMEIDKCYFKSFSTRDFPVLKVGADRNAHLRYRLLSGSSHLLMEMIFRPTSTDLFDLFEPSWKWGGEEVTVSMPSSSLFLPLTGDWVSESLLCEWWLTKFDFLIMAKCQWRQQQHQLHSVSWNGNRWE